MDCFNNTCLSCDRECEAHYCSQACKLADVERGSQALQSPASPTARTSSPSKAWHPSQQSPTDSYSSHRRPQSSYFMWNPSMEASDSSKGSERVLTPSSSRCSLSSTTSSGTSGNAISAHDTQHLQDYFTSLDKARAAKRRSSTR